MKRLLAGMVGVLVANGAWAQYGVLVLGGPPPVVPAQPVACTEPVAYQAPTTVVVQGPVVIQQGPAGVPCHRGGYGGYYGQACAAAPTVIYVAGPGACAPVACASPNVVYFGRMQACQQGYNFTHGR